MPQRKGSQGSTPVAQQGFKSGGAKKAKRNELRQRTLDLALKAATEHVVSLQDSSDAITDPQWAKDVRFYLDHLITGGQFPAHVRRRLSEETRGLARQWVDAARETTGLKPPS